MDCNIQFVELIAELKAIYNTDEEVFTRESDLSWKTLKILIEKHPELENCCKGIEEMDYLRDTTSQPFFVLPEPQAMYIAIKKTQLEANYIVPEDEELKRIKKEILCKAMSVPFYIWQIQRTEPDYQYDNKEEFDSMKEMFALYDASETPCQFKEQISKLFELIERNYKYSTPRTTESAVQKEKK